MYIFVVNVAWRSQTAGGRASFQAVDPMEARYPVEEGHTALPEIAIVIIAVRATPHVHRQIRPWSCRKAVVDDAVTMGHESAELQDFVFRA